MKREEAEDEQIVRILEKKDSQDIIKFTRRALWVFDELLLARSTRSISCDISVHTSSTNGVNLPILQASFERTLRR